MTSRRLLLAPVALLASLGLLACGGDDDTATDAGDTPTAVDGTDVEGPGIKKFSADPIGCKDFVTTWKFV